MLGGQRPKVFGSEVDVEGVIALTPDVMIVLQSALTQDQYNRLSSFNRLAPKLRDALS